MVLVLICCVAAAGYAFSHSASRQIPPEETVPSTSEPQKEVAAEDKKETEEKQEKVHLTADEMREALKIKEDLRESFVHGEKPLKYQKYIVMHDTETLSPASEIISGWDANGRRVAAHFVVNTDGSIVQCVPLQKIAHHAGYGDTGHNQKYGVSEDGRDDMAGSTPIGSHMSDYGMNAWSVGIEMVHVSDGSKYPQAQLESVDKLIHYIDTYFNNENKIIDHKSWRTGNSDCSEEFQPYLKNLQKGLTHDGKSRDNLFTSKAKQ